MVSLWTLFLWLLLGSGYKTIEACDSCGSCLQSPAFISNFITMRAQSDTESTLTIDHGLGEVPIRVEVQVRPSPGRPDTEYVFPGLGSAQVDDDNPEVYGGVVYKYNAQSVVVSVPKKNNGHANGVAIFTGGNIWIGPKQQKEATAEVRVKVWTHCTFPAPYFESSWITMGSGSADHSYTEVKHGLTDDPEYVSVQVKSLNTDWYSDGIGSSTRSYGESAIFGGVIFGANNSHVRLWIPHSKGKMFSATDGWGMGESWTSGLVNVRVWRTFGCFMVYNSTSHINSGLNPAGHQIYTPYLDLASGLIDVKVKVWGGYNAGFNFPASGAVQNVRSGEHFGGVVYSYSEDGVRFWHPHLSAVGSI